MDSNCADEAVKDQGAYNKRHFSYTDRDIEGHKASSYEAGLMNGGNGHRRHGGHRRHRHHHRHHHHKTDDAEDRPVTPPSQRVRFILGEGCEDDDLHPSHPVFSEMEELMVDTNGEMEWRETARWVKFEENVEEGGNRWSKPHVATLSLHSLFELRSTILNGTVMLDCDANSLEQLVDLILDNIRNNGNLSEEYRDKLKDILLRRHRHQHEKRHDNNKGSKITLIRSLADIGRVHSSSKNNSSAGQQDLGLTTSPSANSLSRNHSGGHLTVNEGMTGSTSTSEMQMKGNQHFLKKLPPGTEASNILVGELDFLDHTISAFVRLTQASILGDLTEVAIPTRFVFFILGPQGNIARYHEIGRAVATLMSDEVFHEVAYKGRNRQDLIAAVDEFLDAVTVLPPGEWDPSIRIEPPQKIPSQEHRKAAPDQPMEEIDEELEEERERAASGLRRSGRLFGGLMNDIKRKVPFYLSDFKDALALQCVASFIFLYFACLTPIITFGGLLGQATEDRIAAIESLVSGCLCGLLYGLFSGQPLTILSSTGPVLVFETIAYSFCTESGLDYLSFRLWIGMWTGLILIILVALDASAFVMYITRFTEENFACLISLIFIYKAFENMWEISQEYPVDTHYNPAIGLLPKECNCSAPENYTGKSVDWGSYSIENCTYYNGTLVGEACANEHGYYPDVFLMSMLLFLLTFILSMGLKEVKNSSFFPAKVREVVNDFAVTIAIMSMVALDWYIGLATPKLMVPSNFKPTWSGRGWFIPPFGKNPWWTSIAAIIPALLATILIFMDQQITAVIVNRKEHKLKKGGGYHLDLFVLSILIIINSLLGLPWFVAGTVLAVNHVNSLRMESETAAPGEKPQFLGVREQRVTHLLIFILIGFSVLLTPVLQVIPMPVLYGVFLYMGASSLQGLQFIQRILIVFMPAKYQPDYMFLRQVPLKRVHLFTLVQLACLVSLWVVKSYKATSIAFPLMLVVLIVVRKLLDFVFTRRELKILDDVMPEHTKRKREEEKRRKSEISEDVDENGSNGGEHNGKARITGNYLLVANGSLVKGSSEKFEKLNMSEEVAKSGIWKHVNDNSSEDLTNHKNKNKNKRGSKKDAMNDEENKRLSTMAEEDDEDGPISIRVESPSVNDLSKTKSNSKSKISDKKDSIPTNHNETSV